MEKFLIVNNPNAGRRKAVKYKKNVIKFLLNKNVEFKSVGIDELSEVDFQEIKTVITIGGDGTVNKIIPYIINTDKALAIIPCGTANLLAAKLGISTNIQKSLEVIEKNNIKTIDVIKVNEKFSILRAGFGYDSDIICKTPQNLKNKFGYFAYFLSGIIFALRLKRKKYTITADKKKISILATCIIIANAGNMFKNLVSISNNCKLDDELLDIFILKVQNPIMYFIEFLMILLNKKFSGSKAMYFQAKELYIKNDFTTCHIDGEKQKFKGDIDVKVAPKSVKVFSN